MKALQVVRNLARTEVVVLPEVQQLADDLRRGGARRPVRRPGAVAQACLAVIGEPPFPLVKRLPGDAEVSAGPRHMPSAFFRLRNTLNRHVVNRTWSAFVIASPLQAVGQKIRTRSVTRV
jgi:hypothetical protein